MHGRNEVRLTKRREVFEVAGPLPEEREPPVPERTRFQTWTGDGAQIRTSGKDALIRLDAVLPPKCPPELAELWVLRGLVPGRVYRSGFVLANPDKLRQVWREYQAAKAEGVAS